MDQPPLTVSRNAWLQIQRCLANREDLARKMGEAVCEREEKFQELLASCPAGQPDRARMGQIFYEYLKAEKQFIVAIDNSKKEQGAIGNRALEAAGIDYKAGEYTIAEGGVILRLDAGNWLPMAHLAAHLH